MGWSRCQDHGTSIKDVEKTEINRPKTEASFLQMSGSVGLTKKAESQMIHEELQMLIIELITDFMLVLLSLRLALVSLSLHAHVAHL